MPMPSTVGELKEQLKDLPDDLPIRGELQGEDNWDWDIWFCLAQDNDYGHDCLMISMDM